MSLPEITTREDWLAARTALLAKEKELTRRRDALNAERRRLPMVEITKPYVFTGPDGEASLRDLFGEHLQLILGHFMFDPSWDDGCPSCSAGADEMSDGLIAHLHQRGTELVYVSRAPIEKIEDYKRRKGWTFPWYSSLRQRLQLRLRRHARPSVKPPVYNYRPLELEGEMPGTSYFVRDGDRVFHTYSTFRPRRRADRRLVLLARPHRARAPGGLGGAQGPSDFARKARPDFAT